MVALDITDTSKALAVAGGYVLVIGLVSYFVKERLFMCERNSASDHPISSSFPFHQAITSPVPPFPSSSLPPGMLEQY